MNGKPQIFFSNRVEFLYDELKRKLFSDHSDPFTKRIVINSSPSMKNWIYQRMAFDFGIASGFEFMSPDRAIDLLTNYFFKESDNFNRVPSHLQLSLEIEHEIRKLVNLELLDAEFLPLFNYLNVNGSFNRKNERRLTYLAETLATLFYQYGKYAGRLVKKWEEKKGDNWQSFLWCQLFKKKWSYLYKDLNSLKIWKNHTNFQLHIFAMSYLSSLEIRFLDECAKYIPVNYYLLSPCSTFWSDLMSDKERKKILNVKRSDDLTETQQEALEKYYVVENSLLANSGKLGRVMCRQFEESETYAKYLLPGSVEDNSIYQEYIGPDVEFETSRKPLTLLQSLQSDMVLLRNPEESEKINFSEFDGSIQVHEAANSRREVEILHDIILDIINRHCKDEEPICPKDILVMAPEINSYVPYIKHVFGQEENILDYQILDLNPLTQNSLIQGFLNLLELPFSRWDSVSLLALFENSAFQFRHHLDQEDVNTIKNWIKAAQIRWGEDAAHREELLFRDYELKTKQGNQGTWSAAFDKYLLSLVFKSENVEVENIGLNESELLGKWIFLMKSLSKDLKILSQTGLLLSPIKWSEVLLNLYHQYFAVENNKEAKEKERQLLDQIELFSLESGEFTFQSILIRLKNLLKKGHVSYREDHYNTIKFCTLLPMRAIPAKMIVLMGMQEGNFPKITRKDSLNQMMGSKECDYVPSQNEYDRFLFLETLLSARNYYVITYQNQSEGKVQQPSILVTELLSYLDKSCLVSNKKPSEVCIIKNTFQAYDKQNFRKDSLTKSYSFINYQAACSFYNSTKIEPRDWFEYKPKIQDLDIVTIDIKQLNLCARNPYQIYFNQMLKMYLEKENKREIPIDEAFSFSSLEKFHIRKLAFRHSFKDIFDNLDKQEKLPIEPYRSLAYGKLQTEIENLKLNLMKNGISESSFFDIEMGEGLEGENRLFPPLIIENEGRKVKIVGKLSDITSNGLVADIKDDKVEIHKLWPQFLIYNALIQKHNLSFERKIICLKNGKAKESFFSDSFGELNKFVNYYFKSLENLSPLLPEWIPEILNGNVSNWETKIRNQINGRFSTFNQDYVLWSLRGKEIPKLNNIIENWKEQASTLYSELYENWYPEK